MRRKRGRHQGSGRDRSIWVLDWKIIKVKERDVGGRETGKDEEISREEIRGVE